jgi:carbonic anhydrase/acetyltransferase-like protein (isoleucine patch superfamily)
MPLILPYRHHTPRIHERAFIAENAVIIGDVEIGEGANIWYGCVIRGDVSHIRIGARTNVQDGTVIHVTESPNTPTLIGCDVTIGHMALLHACTVQDRGFIGMHSTVMDRVVVESESMVAAGALVPPGKTIPTGQVWAGNPARYLRDIKPDERAYITHSATKYAKLGAEYRVA